MVGRLARLWHAQAICISRWRKHSDLAGETEQIRSVTRLMATPSVGWSKKNGAHRVGMGISLLTQAQSV